MGLKETLQWLNSGSNEIIVFIIVVLVINLLLLLLIYFLQNCHFLYDQEHESYDQEHYSWFPSGVGQAVITSLPVLRFSAANTTFMGSMDCSVCLSEFEDAEMIRLLPDCNHAFHLNCIDAWLKGHSTCPVCRAKVVAVDKRELQVVISR